jgi:hypothetical protein
MPLDLPKLVLKMKEFSVGHQIDKRVRKAVFLK